jgi:hypothetical protein
MDCEKCQKEHEYRLENLDKKVEKFEEFLSELKSKSVEIEASTKSAHKRLGEIGEMPQAVLKMSFAVESIANEVKELTQGMKEHQKDIGERVTTLEKAPGKQAYDLQRKIIVAVILTIVSFYLGKWGIR